MEALKDVSSPPNEQPRPKLGMCSPLSVRTGSFNTSVSTSTALFRVAHRRKISS